LGLFPVVLITTEEGILYDKDGVPINKKGLLLLPQENPYEIVQSNCGLGPCCLPTAT